MKKTKNLGKKILSLFMVMIVLLGVAPANMFDLSAKAIEFTYNPDAAIAFAKAHCETDAGKIPNDTDGTEACVNGWLCAEFVAECLLAGGFPKKLSAVAGLGGFGGQITAYGEKITCTKTGAGYVKMSTFSKKLSKGTPIVLLYGYGSGSGNGHVVIYSGETESDGTLKVYGHNNRNQNGRLYSIARTVEIFAVDLSAHTVTSKPTNVSVNNNFVHINWEAHSDAEYYNIRIRRILNGEEIADEYSLWSVKDLKTALALPDGEYRIYVEAKNKNGGSYKYNDAYVTVVSKAPIISSIVKNGQVIFNWSDYTGDFHHYNLKIYTDKIWGSECKVFDNLNENSHVVNLSNGHYQAYVDVCDKDGNVIASGSVCTFDVSLMLTRTSVGNNIAFYSWTEHSGAKCYNLRAKKIDGDTWVESDASVWGITDTSSTLELPEGKYYVYVDAVTDDGVCKYTDDTVTISYKDPRLGVDVNDPNVVFSWTKHENADHYRLRIYKNKIWTDHVATYNNIADLSYTTVLDSGVYAALVEVMDSNNNVVYYGTAIKFTIDHQHSYEVFSEFEATCEFDGETTYVCSCGDSYKTTTPAKGHNYNEYVIAPTETEMGYTRYSCDCGDTYTDDYIPALGGVSVLGNVTTFSSTDMISLELVKNGESDVSYSKMISGDENLYSIINVNKGNYTLFVSKPNHVTREYEITIGAEDVNLDVQLNLIGDINGDGKITLLDYTQVLRHVKKTSTLDGYEYNCADVNGDGKLTVTDYARILKHVKKTETLW